MPAPSRTEALSIAACRRRWRDMASDFNNAAALELEALIAKATDENLSDGGRYFADSCTDLTQCRHSEIGEYGHASDGELIEWLWNHRRMIHSALAKVAAAPELLASLIELLEPLERASAALVANGKVANEAAESAFEAGAAQANEPLSTIAGKVRELVSQEEAGHWRECSGCYETEDGYPVGHYPYSPALKCHLGAGCSECGGIGAIWDSSDYGDYADFSRAAMRDHDNIRAVLTGDGGLPHYQAEQLAMAITALAIPPILHPDPNSPILRIIADVEHRAAQANAQWEADGKPGIDYCDKRALGARMLGAKFAFSRLAKDLREGLAKEATANG